MKHIKSIFRCAALLLALMLGVLAHAATTTTYYHNDLLGSPVAATDASGHVIWRESYRPYGERLTNDPASTANDVWYTSRRQDADTGLVYMGARYYDPVAGRFVSKDPVGFDEGNIQSFNRYAYANNNPYRFVDPTGRDAADVKKWWNESVDSLTSDSPGDAVMRFLQAIPGEGIALGALGGAIKATQVSETALVAVKSQPKVDAVIAETLAAKGNVTSALKLSADELLEAGERFMGPGYKEVGKPGSGVFRSADETRQFRIDNSSLLGEHGPNVPHGHLEVFEAGKAKPVANNHIPFHD